MQADEPAATTWQDAEEQIPTSYEVLQVHPAAPLELITAAYWRLAGDVQARRSVDSAAEAELHALTRAYQTLTNPELRAEYDHSVGIAEQHLAPLVPHSRKKGLFGRNREIGTNARVDYYEILRIVPAAEPQIVEEAYSTLRTYYVRLVQSGYSPIELLDYLEDAYLVTSDPERREKYDAERKPVPVVVTPVIAVATNPVTDPNEPAQKKAKPAPVAPKPKAAAVQATRKSLPARPASGGSPIAAVTGALGVLGRQFSTMSKREQEQLEDRKVERDNEHVDTSEVEAALLQRISSSVDAPDEMVDEPSRSIARVLVTNGPDHGTIFEIHHFPLTMGADEACDITLPALASEHARLLFRDGRFVVYNLTPPQVDTAEEFEPWWVVESGDDLALGPYKLRFTAIGD